MRVALAGVGRMGSAIATRLRAAGHDLTLYDPALPAGQSAPSLAAAARDAAIALLCLPDAGVVESCLPGLAEAAPALVVDLTSSLPATTRRMAAALAPAGVAFMDCPLSGGVAGARAGTLTAMAGGDPELLERARPVLAAFAAAVRWAGPLGSGHATKALNNALSAAALLGTAEVVVTAAAHGVEEAAAVDACNAGAARSQNSEVKFPRDVLPRTYGAGFTAGLMVKDLGIAARIAAGGGAPAPLLAGLLEAWREAAGAMGLEADFTRVHAVIEARQRPTREALAGPADLATLTGALAGLHLLMARELMGVATAEGLDRDRVLDIVNASTGRTEATRERLRGQVDGAVLAAAAELARAAGVWAPLTSLAAGTAPNW